jgi:hypothetical protein
MGSDLLVARNADSVALASLLKVMIMLEDAPPAFVAKLYTEHADLATQAGPTLQQRRSIFTRSLLPVVLLPIVAEYAVITPEDMWTKGLHVEATANDGKN